MEKAKLIAEIKDKKSFLCVGLDTDMEKIPKHLLATEDPIFELSNEDFSNIILAYEPVWAIGTGKTATAEQAEDMHAFIRQTIAEQFGQEVAENVSILYGGSCKPSNAKEIFSKPNVDGGLIGGAALKVADFKGIIDAWN